METLQYRGGKPFLKWAGGKTQLLARLSSYIPDKYDKYIEPFVGGGALFFHLAPSKAIIADLNPELVCTYKVVRDRVDELISVLSKYPHDRHFYYELRSTQPQELNRVERAARFIYLNKCGFNGLYRVNKRGEFNVPFGKQKKPLICDEQRLNRSSQILKNSIIVTSDYKDVIEEYAEPGDFVYLDPPYDPVSNYSDFTRFTKDFFYAEDQVEVAKTFKNLVARGVFTLLTNSNTEFTRRLYQDFPYEVVDSRRNINSNGKDRVGEDLIVFPEGKNLHKAKSNTFDIMENFPGTRFMGSKYSVLDFIWESLADLKFSSVLDAFAGSGVVSYLFKKKGKQVFSNDLMSFSYHIANSLIQNNATKLTSSDLEMLLGSNPHAKTFIQKTFQGLYFTDIENKFLDLARTNIEKLTGELKKSLAISALVRACLKKRPRGIFTYVGFKYNDDRKDLHTSLRDHYINALEDFNSAVYSNGLPNRAYNTDVFDLGITPDLVYLDPPYYSPKSDSDYVRRYHFVEGLARYWEGVEIQKHTKTKKIAKYPTAFDGKDATYQAFPKLFEKFKNSIIVVSYSSNSLPSKSEMVEMLKQYKENVKVYQADHRYSFGNQYSKSKTNEVLEYLFVGY